MKRAISHSFSPPITSAQSFTKCRILFWTSFDSWSMLSWNCHSINEIFNFQTENSYFTLFFPPITLVQGLTQCRIWFWTNFDSWVSLLSWNFNITNELFNFQTENSYFTLFFPPITSVQGLTQCRIWFWTNLDSWVSLLSWNINITNKLFPFQPENSYFTLFFPPITSGQGLTQCQIWF